jgi:hypothetical protein
MISHFREQMQKVVRELEAGYADDDNINSDQLLLAYRRAGIEFTEHDYDGGFYTRTYLVVNFKNGNVIVPETIKHTLTEAALTKEELVATLFNVRKYRLQWLTLHILYEKTRWGLSMPFMFQQSSKSGLIYIDIQRYQGESWKVSLVKQYLQEFCNSAFTDKQRLIAAQLKYHQLIESLEKRISALSKDDKTGLDSFFEKKPGAPDFLLTGKIKNQFNAAYEAMPANGLTARTWGFEVEIADAKGVDAVYGIDKGSDGSLRSENTDYCECECSDCTYHDCNCDWCENQNADPEHCGDSYCNSADSAEFRSTRGINRLQHAGLFKICKQLKEVDAEVNDSCGIHIHVYAQDLETKEIANVMATYKWLENIIAVIAEREDVNYAKKLPMSYVRSALKGHGLVQDKPRAVNLTHITGQLNMNRGTIEFRQMAGTYDAKRITTWAWFVRGLVDTAKRGMRFHDVTEVRDFDGIIEVFAKYNYFLHDEQPQRLIPGATRDNEYINRVSHRLVDRV